MLEPPARKGSWLESEVLDLLFLVLIVGWCLYITQ